MGVFGVEPDGLPQFGEPGADFRLVTTAEREPDVELLPSAKYRTSSVLALRDGQSLADLLGSGAIPESADVLVLCPQRFLTSPTEAELGMRRLSVLPCGSTPVTDAALNYFLGALGKSDPVRQERFCAALAEAIGGTEQVRIVDRRYRTEAWLRVHGDYAWNQQAGVLAPGEQQVAPAGEFSALPTDIMSFDEDARLGLNGTLIVDGPPIVHRAENTELLGTQRRLFDMLDTTRIAPLRLEITDGLITDWRAIDARAELAAEALYELFDRSDRYRIVWEFGIGCNEAIEPQPGNCGMNEMFGSENGVLHIGLGLTPSTDFAITLSCRQSVGYDDEGTRIFGADKGRMNRKRSASCGCVG